uniref:hypothetical protein n=1 Tax=Escherichia coli TaxID=562 RepID=UPI0037BE2461
MDNEFRFISDISSSINDVKKLIDTGVFNQSNPLFKPALIQLLILARDLTYKSFKLGKTIDFTDDVKVSGKVTDVTMLIKYCRDAACHIDSDNHLSIESNVLFSFNVCFGKANIAQIGDTQFSSEYDDDICIFFGDQKIYLKRHILRAIREAEAFFKQHYKDHRLSHFLS